MNINRVLTKQLCSLQMQSENRCIILSNNAKPLDSFRLSATRFRNHLPRTGIVILNAKSNPNKNKN